MSKSKSKSKYVCEKCGSDNIQTFEMAFHSGTGTVEQSNIARMVAPPSNPGFLGVRL